MKKTKTKTSASGLKATKKVHSARNYEIIYMMTAEVKEGRVRLSCSCKGWIYQCQRKGTLCKHLREHKDELENEIRGAIAAAEIGNGDDKMAVLGGI